MIHLTGNRLLISGAIVLLILGGSPPAVAAIVRWNIGDGDWVTDANWQGAIQPGTGDDAYITYGGGTARINDGDAIEVRLFLVSNTTSAAIVMSGGTLTAQGDHSRVGSETTGTFTQTGGDVNVDSKALYIGFGTNGNGTYTMSDGSLTTTYIRVGENGTGLFNHTGGIVKTTSNDLILGRYGTASGVYNLSANGDLRPYTLNVGGRNGESAATTGTGTLNQDGGTNAVSRDLFIGSEGGTGTYNLSSGTLTVGLDIRKGSSTHSSAGSSTFNIEGPTSGYTLTVTGGDIVVDNFGVGYAVGSNGQFNLTGSGPNISVGNEYVGYEGTGSVTQSGKTNAIANDLSLGGASGSAGTYALAGGTLSVGGDITGGAGASTFNIEGSSYTLTVTGGDITVDNFGVGQATGSNGQFNLTGSGPNISVDNAYVGHQGTGSITQSGSTNTIANNLSIGAGGGTGTYRITGGTLDVGGDITGGGASYFNIDALESAYSLTVSGGDINVDDLRVGNASGTTGELTIASGLTVTTDWQSIGYNGTGTLTQTGGANMVTNGTGALYVGRSGTGVGTYNLGGNGQLTAKFLRVGESGQGIFNHSDGTVTVNSNDVIVGRFTGSTGEYNLSGNGVINARALCVGGRDSGDGTNPTLGGSGTFNQTGGTNDIATSLYLGTRNGNGTYVISDGLLDVDGTLVVGNTGTDIAPLYIDKTGTGRFKISGDSAVIEVDGYSQNGLSTLELAIDGGISPINVDGGISLDGFLDVEFLTTATLDSSYALFVNDGTDPVDGIFSGLAEDAVFTVPGPSGSYMLTISYFANVDGGSIGNDVVLTVVPEPSTFVLFAGLLLLLLARVRPARRVHSRGF